MAVMVQIRNVPDDLHRKLKARAALAGMSISEYLLREIERSLARPTPEELLQRLRSHGKVDLSESVAAEREGRWSSSMPRPSSRSFCKPTLEPRSPDAF